MKNIVIGIFSVVIILLSILTIFSITGREQREVELENALNNAMETALEGLMEVKEYQPSSNEELIADFQQAFFMQINSMSDITINILDVDYEKGLLGVEAISEFTYFTGTKGSVSVTKWMILDKYENELSNTSYEITYLVKTQMYRRYSINYGENLIVPPQPDTGSVITGWKETATGQIYTEAQLTAITCDHKMTFEAVYN